MTEEQIQEFEMWLPQVIGELGPELNIPEEVSQSIANAQSVEEVDAILNEISQAEGGQEILSNLVSAFDNMNETQTQTMKIGGKINYFVEKYGKGGKCCKKENGGEVKEDKCGGKVKKKKCCGGCKTIKAQGGEQLPEIYNNGLEAAADAMPKAFKVMPLFNDSFYDYNKTMPIPKMVLSGETDKQKQARKSTKKVSDSGYATRRKVGTSIPSIVPENAVWPHSVSNIVYEDAVIGPKGKETSAVTYAIAGMPAIGDTLIDQRVGRDHHIITKGSPEYDTIMGRLRKYFPTVEEEKKGGCIKRK